MVGRPYTREERNVLGAALVHYIQSLQSDNDEDRSQGIAVAQRLLAEVRADG